MLGPEYSQVIAHNGGNGLSIEDCITCQVEASVFGSATSGGLDGNADAGIALARTSGIAIENNLIGENGGDGVVILSGTPSIEDRIQFFRIFGNGEEGIDLGSDGPTPNDTGDIDLRQSHPDLDPLGTYHQEATWQIFIRYRLDGGTPDVAFPVAVYLSVATRKTKRRSVGSVRSPSARRTVALS